MPQPKKAARFGGAPAHHNLILANLATELIRHGRINTTYAKAKTVQPLAERMITFAKRGDIHSRRQVLRIIRDKDVVHKLFTDVGPAFSQRDGGYTRVLKTGPRKGDAAPMAIIELVEGIGGDGESTLEEAPRRRWSLRRRRGTRSATARARQEERAARIDRGELPDELEELEDDALAEEDTAAKPSPEAGPPDTGEEEEGPQVQPADVEARLAAQEDAADEEEAREVAEQTDTASPSVPADEEAEEIARQADSEVSPSEWNADQVEEAPRAGEAGGDGDGEDATKKPPVPSEEQDAPAPERPADEED